MSRSGYSDDYDDNWSLIKWRGQVASAIRGKRGQKLLQELADAMDAMPVKELISESLADAEGGFCTLGVVGHARALDMADIDPEDLHQVSQAFNIAEALAAEIVFMNDECDNRWDGNKYLKESPAERFIRMRKWVAEQIIVWDNDVAAQVVAK